MSASKRAEPVGAARKGIVGAPRSSIPTYTMRRPCSQHTTSIRARVTPGNFAKRSSDSVNAAARWSASNECVAFFECESLSGLASRNLVESVEVDNPDHEFLAADLAERSDDEHDERRDRHL